MLGHLGGNGAAGSSWSRSTTNKITLKVNWNWKIKMILLHTYRKREMINGKYNVFLPQLKTIKAQTNKTYKQAGQDTLHCSQVHSDTSNSLNQTQWKFSVSQMVNHEWSLLTQWIANTSTWISKWREHYDFILWSRDHYLIESYRGDNMIFFFK